jgi:hypothetical protein
LIASLNSVSVSSVSAETTCELDLHADTSVAGSNSILLEEPTRTVDVFGFSPELPLIKKVPIATVGTAWVDPKSGQSYLLILNECLFICKTMNHSLLNPNQLRCNGVIVQDTPTMFDPTSTHSIYDPTSGMRIPLDLTSVISYFPTNAPTLEEANLMKPIVLTSNANWTAVSAACPNQQRISKVEAAKPYRPTQHMFMIEHANTLLETVPRMTTAGWEMEVQWADGSTDWLPLKDLKDSNPIEAAKYAISNGIFEEPAFSWWA